MLLPFRVSVPSRSCKLVATHSQSSMSIWSKTLRLWECHMQYKSNVPTIFYFYFLQKRLFNFNCNSLKISCPFTPLWCYTFFRVYHYRVQPNLSFCSQQSLSEQCWSYMTFMPFTRSVSCVFAVVCCVCFVFLVLVEMNAFYRWWRVWNWFWWRLSAFWGSVARVPLSWARFGLTKITDKFVYRLDTY